MIKLKEGIKVQKIKGSKKPWSIVKVSKGLNATFVTVTRDDGKESYTYGRKAFLANFEEYKGE